MYDVIVVGARCAGSPAAMLLARKGYRVLLLDRSSFPSDTISTHIIFPRGQHLLSRWGLLDSVRETGCAEMTSMGMDPGPFRLFGTLQPYHGISTILAPRRKYLDDILVHAAVDAGVELREECIVEDVIMDGTCVTGVRVRQKNGAAFTEKGRIVIGADGRHSIVARCIDAQEYNATPAMTSWYYTYWSGLERNCLEFFMPPGRAIGFIPTNDDLVCIPVIWSQREFHTYRADIEKNYLRSFAAIPGLEERMRSARREDQFYGMAGLAGYYRQSYGPGWALVGDAGYHRDPMTGQGISDAFAGAQALTDAIDAGFSGRESLESALHHYVEERDTSTAPMYQMTSEWASLQPPPPEMQQLLVAMEGNPQAISAFFTAITGGSPLPDFFSEENIGQIMRSAATAS